MKQDVRQPSRTAEYAGIILMAVVGAFAYQLLIFPNSFAPAGINGLATMVQYLFHFSLGYLSLIVNVPLCLYAWFAIGHEYAVKTTVYVVAFSLAMLVLQYGVDVSSLEYYTADGKSQILAPLASGAIDGVLYGFIFRIDGSTGGVDIIAAGVHKMHPQFNMVWIIFALNCIVAGISYFVYGFNMEPVILCIIYCFVSSRFSDEILKGGKQAVKFEVITPYPEEMSAELIRRLQHGVTVVPATGMYSHEAKSLLICVVNKHQVVEFIEIVQQYENSFAYASSVNETVGNFARIR